MSFSKEPTRREFLFAGSSAALATAVSAQASSSGSEAPSVSAPESQPYSSEALFADSDQRTFSGDRATQVTMPLGGIGAGSICFPGAGNLARDQGDPQVRPA